MIDLAVMHIESPNSQRRDRLTRSSPTPWLSEARRHLDSIRAEIASLPEDQRHERTAEVLLALQSLGDLYDEFAADVLRILLSHGRPEHSSGSLRFEGFL
jgi:hypothetical protein